MAKDAAAYRCGLLRWSRGKLQRVIGVDDARAPGLGKPARAGTPPGLYRSDDAGKNWRRIDDDAHRFGGIIRHVTGDPRTTGRVCFGTEGRGIRYGDPQ